MIDLSLNEHVLRLTDIRFFEMDEFACELPRKFISFHCLENNSNEPKDSNTEVADNFPDPPERNKSDVEYGPGGDESPERIVVGFEVIPVFEVHKESAEGVIVHNCSTFLRTFKMIVEMKVLLM